MIHEDLYILHSEEPIDERIMQIAKVLQKYKVEVRIFQLERYAFERCNELIDEMGISQFYSLEEVHEALLPRTDSSKSLDLLEEVLIKHLEAFKPTDNLVIIDNYFFNIKDSQKAEYFELIRNVFGPFLGRIKTLKFITKPSYKDDVFHEAQNLLKAFNNELTIIIKTADIFHDRFWIIDERAGFFVGTSLNGIGKRYALVDKIRADDTREILRVLKNESLI